MRSVRGDVDIAVLQSRVDRVLDRLQQLESERALLACQQESLDRLRELNQALDDSEAQIFFRLDAIADEIYDLSNEKRDLENKIQVGRELAAQHTRMVDIEEKENYSQAENTKRYSPSNPERIDTKNIWHLKYPVIMDRILLVMGDFKAYCLRYSPVEQSSEEVALKELIEMACLKFVDSSVKLFGLQTCLRVIELMRYIDSIAPPELEKQLQACVTPLKESDPIKSRLLEVITNFTRGQFPVESKEELGSVVSAPQSLFYANAEKEHQHKILDNKFLTFCDYAFVNVFTNKLEASIAQAVLMLIIEYFETKLKIVSRSSRVAVSVTSLAELAVNVVDAYQSTYPQIQKRITELVRVGLVFVQQNARDQLQEAVLGLLCHVDEFIKNPTVQVRLRFAMLELRMLSDAKVPEIERLQDETDIGVATALPDWSSVTCRHEFAYCCDAAINIVMEREMHLRQEAETFFHIDTLCELAKTVFLLGYNLVHMLRDPLSKPASLGEEDELALYEMAYYYITRGLLISRFLEADMGVDCHVELLEALYNLHRLDMDNREALASKMLDYFESVNVASYMDAADVTSNNYRLMQACQEIALSAVVEDSRLSPS